VIRRVFRSPATPDPDKAPWEQTHPKVRAVRRDAAAAGKLPAQAGLDRLNRARGPRGAEPPTPPAPRPPAPPLGMADDPDRSAPTASGSSFWAPPVPDEPPDDGATAEDFLSGDEDFFDPATGWDFQAITDSQITAIAEPRAADGSGERATDDSGEFAVEIDEEDPAPSQLGPPPTVDEALKRVQIEFGAGRDAAALDLLTAALRTAPNDPRLQTWIEFAERRIMLRLCPNGGTDRVLRLAHPLPTLLQAASPDLAPLLAAVDGRTRAAALRELLALDATTFWTAVGRLIERGWIAWIDDA
jgi:hypothetical protein